MTKSLLARPASRFRLPLPPIESLESRLLLSITGTGAPPPFLPNESTLTSPKFTDLWHLQNTGQTLSSPSQGPATGIAGDDISAAQAWNLNTGSRSVIIAVLDTGIDWSQPDLAANLWTNPAEATADGSDNDGNGFVDDIHGWNFVNNNNNTNDTVGHGTSVAGVIGAVGNNGLGIAGVAWNVSLLPVVVGTAAGVNDNNLVAGINYVIGLKNEGYNIVAINASYLQTTPTVPTSADINAISNAGKAGLLYINAAGNGSANISSLNLLPGWSSLTNVITVAATNNEDQLASFSNFGPGVVQLAAPGVDILTTTPGDTYSVLSGTSYAAPMVSGAAAALASINPGITMAQIKSDILSSVDKVSGLTDDVSTGGRLNVYAALQTVIGSQPPVGAIEQTTSTTVTGYAYDANAGQIPVTVFLTVDGNSITSATANINRPDLAPLFGSADHGFSIPLPTNLSLGNHTISVFANDYPGTTKVLIGTKTITITPTQPTVTFKGAPLANNQPNAIDFSGQLVGAPPQVRSFVVRNQSNQTLLLSNLTVPSGYIITDNLVTSLTPGAADTITIELSTATKGVYQGNVAFNWGTSSTFAFPVSGALGDSFVQNLYLDLLGRPADTNGLNYWNSTLINQTMTPTQITAGFVNSTEYRTIEIKNLYTSILGRPADSGSIQYWLNAFNNGETVEQISAGFYGSQEYFVAHNSDNPTTLNGFYVGILGRSIDSSGLSYWSSALAGGSSRTTVAFDIINTTEGEQRTVESLYTTYLHRSVDPAGLTYWTNQLAHGLTQDTMLISLLSSPEYFAR